jgi:hypothetical protein
MDAKKIVARESNQVLDKLVAKVETSKIAKIETKNDSRKKK